MCLSSPCDDAVVAVVHYPQDFCFAEELPSPGATNTAAVVRIYVPSGNNIVVADVPHDRPGECSAVEVALRPWRGAYAVADLLWLRAIGVSYVWCSSGEGADPRRLLLQIFVTGRYSRERHCK